MINNELPNIKVHDTTVQQLAFLLPILEVPGSVRELEPGFPNWDFHGHSEPLYTKSGTVPSTDHDHFCPCLSCSSLTTIHTIPSTPRR